MTCMHWKSEVIISATYNCLLGLNTHSTSYIKEKWEKESGIQITDKEWETIWKCQWKCTSSMSWKEFNWKNLIRYFITPYQKHKCSDTVPACWRQCGQQCSDHYHVFWDCPNIRTFWTEIHQALQDIFGEDTALDFKMMYLGCVPKNWLKVDKYLFNILMVASKKAITRNWLQPHSPTIIMWRDIVVEIYKMEGLTAHVNQNNDVFLDRWLKWFYFVPAKWPNESLL